MKKTCTAAGWFAAGVVATIAAVVGAAAWIGALWCEDSERRLQDQHRT